MRTLAAAAALATMAAATPVFAQAPDGAAHMMKFDGAFLSISADAQAKAAPDMATINAGVLTEAATAEAAMAQNATRMNNVIAALKKAGIADKDIQTSQLNLNPQYQYNNNEPPKLTGYQAQNTVSVKVHNLKNVGKAIDAVVGQGSNQINGVSFEIEDPDPVLDQARKDAMKKARARAELYAQAAGMKVARIVSITEGGGYNPPPYPVPMMARADMMKQSTPVAPGEVSMSINVGVTFELR